MMKYTSSNGEVKDGETGDQLHKPFRGEFILIAPERHHRKKLGELGIHRHPHLCICRTTSRPFVIQPAGAHTGFKFSEVKMEIVSPSRYDMSAIFLLIKQSFNTSRQSLVWISLVWGKVCSLLWRWRPGKPGPNLACIFHNMQSSVNSETENHGRGETRWGWKHKRGVGWKRAMIP